MMIAMTMSDSRTSSAGYTRADSVFRRTVEMILTYEMYRRMTWSRLPLFSPASSDAV